MKIKWLFFVILLIIVFSCRKSISNEEQNTNLDSISANLLITKHKEVKLNAKAKIEVEDWTEYNKMDEFLKQYHHISSIDALFNANELSELAQQLKDTIRVEKFEIQAQVENGWKTVVAGKRMGDLFEETFEPIKTRRVRLNILNATEGPTLWEFQVFPPKK